MDLLSPEQFRARLIERLSDDLHGDQAQIDYLMVHFDALAAREDSGDFMTAVQSAPRRSPRAVFLAIIGMNAGYARALSDLQHGGTPTTEEQDDDGLSVEQLLAKMPPANASLGREHLATQVALLASIRKAAENTSDPDGLLRLVEAYYKLPPVDEDDLDPNEYSGQ